MQGLLRKKVLHGPRRIWHERFFQLRTKSGITSLFWWNANSDKKQQEKIAKKNRTTGLNSSEAAAWFGAEGGV